MASYTSWTDEQSAALKRLIAGGLTVREATPQLNLEFGTSRTRKSCSAHLWDSGRRTARTGRGSWPAEHDRALKQLIADGLSRADAAGVLNRRFHTTYSRNACIGRLRRLEGDRPPIEKPPSAGQKELTRRATAKRREKRWAADPSLKERYDRLQHLKANRKLMLANGATRTSKEYRKHIPRIAHMTKGELRAMLSQAVQNTAAMGIAA